jgi:fluoride exporter
MPGRDPAPGRARDDRPDRPGDGVPAGRPTGRRQWDVLAVVSVGGGLGSIARYGLARAWTTPPGGFPWATFTTNVAGSLALGLLMVYVIEVWPPSRYRRPFLGVGIIGGFTTFSTYMSEVRGLLATGHFSLADAYALSSLLAGLAAVWTGIAVARRLSGLPVRRGPSRRSQAGRTATATAAQPLAEGSTR